MVREGRVFDSLNLKPVFGVGYSVVVYEPGAEVATASSGTTVAVQPGHGLASGDYVMADLDTTTFRRVLSTTSTTVEVSANLPVAAGQFLVNLGADTGVSGPDFLGSGATIYADSGYVTEAAASHVRTGSDGTYRYWHKGISRWELILGEVQEPLFIVTDTNVPVDEDPVQNEIRYAHLFATSGSGTAADPWLGESIMAAWEDLPGHMGTIKCIRGVWDLGSDSVGLNFDYNGTFSTGFVLEGSGGGNEATDAFTNDGATVFQYSGTGEAIRIGSFSTSTSLWLENSVVRGIKLQQTGTAGTGIGLLARLFRWGLFEDLNFVDFAIGGATASVSDFNIWNRCRSHDCRTYHFEMGRVYDAAGNVLGGTGGQCNGNRFINCDIKNSNRDLGFTNWGIWVGHNCVNITIEYSEFHNFDTSGYAAVAIDDGVTDSSTVTVDNCYFEGNYASVYHNNPFGAGTWHRSITVTNNYIAQIEGYGIWVNSGSTGVTSGVVIHGNTLDVPSSSAPYNTAIGIQLGFYIENANVHSNAFSILNVVGTLPGGNVKQAGTTITEDNYVVGTSRQTGAAVFMSTLAVTGASTLTGAVATTTHATIGGQFRRSVAAAVTASTTQTQAGGTALTADINNVSVCANASDTVTLPTAVAGMHVTIINSGAQGLRIFPFSGDNLGAGADTQRANLAAAGTVRFVALDATNWKEV